MGCSERNELAWHLSVPMPMPNLSWGWEATIRTECEEKEWFPLGKAVTQGWVSSSYCLVCIRTYHAKNSTRFRGRGVGICGRNINNSIYIDDTI